MLNILRKLWNYLEKIIYHGSQQKITKVVHGEMNINNNSQSSSLNECKINNVNNIKIKIPE